MFACLSVQFSRNIWLVARDVKEDGLAPLSALSTPEFTRVPCLIWAVFSS